MKSSHARRPCPRPALAMRSQSPARPVACTAWPAESEPTTRWFVPGPARRLTRVRAVIRRSIGETSGPPSSSTTVFVASQPKPVKSVIRAAPDRSHLLIWCRKCTAQLSACRRKMGRQPLYLRFFVLLSKFVFWRHRAILLRIAWRQASRLPDTSE